MSDVEHEMDASFLPRIFPKLKFNCIKLPRIYFRNIYFHNEKVLLKFLYCASQHSSPIPYNICSTRIFSCCGKCFACTKNNNKNDVYAFSRKFNLFNRNTL